MLGADTTDGDFMHEADWTDIHDITPKLELHEIDGSINHYEQYAFVMRGYVEDGWDSLANLDKIASVQVRFYFPTPYDNSAHASGLTWAQVNIAAIYDQVWDPDTATGKHYDGVTNWDDYHPLINYPGGWDASLRQLTIANLPMEKSIWWSAFDGPVGAPLLGQSDNIFHKGFYFETINFSKSYDLWFGDYGTNKAFGIAPDILWARIKYWNPITNALSRYSGPSTGLFPVVFSGLGFDNSMTEICEGSIAVNNTVDDIVDTIDIENPAGAVVATLSRTGGDFTVDSNSQITIATFPALPAGTYCFNLDKDLGMFGHIEGHAGDYKCYADGLVYASTRIWFWVYDVYVPPTIPIVPAKICFKKDDGTVECKYYAPIDVRSPTTFYEGMILSVSPFTRGTNDLTGLPVFSDMEVELDNTTREFSKLLAEYWVKNQPMWLYFGWREQPETWKETIFKGVVTDYEKPGTTWRVRLRDMMEKYFQVKVPKYRCIADEYPNIHPNHVAKEMPELLGEAHLDTGACPGAVEAICISTTAYMYLAARRSLYAVTAVYSDGVLKATPGDYSINYTGGRTYIIFTADQGDNKVTFDFEGYSYAGWDSVGSTGGFIRNPAYIILYLFMVLAEVPISEIDMGAFDDLADDYEALGFGDSGYLILQDQRDVSSVLQELLFTYGAKCWITLDGKITIGRKDASNLSTSVHLFEQIDAIGEPRRPIGFNETVNYAPVKWQYFPTANFFLSSTLKTRQSSIDAFEVEIMPSTPWDFPWTDDSLLVDMRTAEELLKLGFGDQHLELKVSIEHIDELDILDTFGYQDPFGLDVLGIGEVAHYYYIEKLTYDVLGGTITILAIDQEFQVDVSGS